MAHQIPWVQQVPVLTKLPRAQHRGCFRARSPGQDGHEIGTGHFSNTLSSTRNSRTRWALRSYFCAASVPGFNSLWEQDLLGEAYSRVVRYSQVNVPETSLHAVLKGQGLFLS